MDDELTNRRGLIRGIALQVAQRARELATAQSEMGSQLPSLGTSASPADAVAGDQTLRMLLPAQSTERFASRERGASASACIFAV